jgi:hypothetical protein
LLSIKEEEEEEEEENPMTNAGSSHDSLAKCLYIIPHSHCHVNNAI